MNSSTLFHFFSISGTCYFRSHQTSLVASAKASGSYVHYI